MTPYYEEPGVRLYHGDCRDVLPALPQADLLLTDPPYGLGARIRQGGTWAKKAKFKTAPEWDRPPDPVVLASVVLPAGRVGIVWGGNYFALPPSRCWLVWAKRDQIPTMADFELAWTSLDRPSKMVSTVRSWDWKPDHAAAKPVCLMEWCIAFVRAARVPVASVVDPYCGSGSTLLAARNLRVPVVGIEREERFCALTVRRLRSETKAFGLFS